MIDFINVHVSQYISFAARCTHDSTDYASSLTITLRYCVKTAKAITEIPSTYGKPSELLRRLRRGGSKGWPGGGRPQACIMSSRILAPPQYRSGHPKLLQLETLLLGLTMSELLNGV